MDRLALKLGIDRLEMRRRNAYAMMTAPSAASNCRVSA